MGPGVTYDEFARLRVQVPVAWFPDQGSGFWSAHRYADIVAARRDAATTGSPTLKTTCCPGCCARRSTRPAVGQHADLSKSSA